MTAQGGSTHAANDGMAKLSCSFTTASSQLLDSRGLDTSLLLEKPLGNSCKACRMAFLHVSGFIFMQSHDPTKVNLVNLSCPHGHRTIFPIRLHLHRTWYWAQLHLRTVRSTTNYAGNWHWIRLQNQWKKCSHSCEDIPCANGPVPHKTCIG